MLSLSKLAISNKTFSFKDNKIERMVPLCMGPMHKDYPEKKKERTITCERQLKYTFQPKIISRN